MKKIIKISFVSLIFLTVLYLVVNSYSGESELKVYVLDVGQGDGILIRTPSGHNIIIDGGPDNTFIQQVGSHLPFYDRQIDLVILSHPHADHLTGLMELFRRYRVKKVLASKVHYNSTAYKILQELISSKNLPYQTALSGQELIFQKDCSGKVYCQPNPVNLKIIYPFENFENQVLENVHDSMVVARLSFGQIDFLFMGDLEKEGESELMSNAWSKTLLDSEVLKIGHHGSETSSESNFLDAVSPEIALISVGQNNKFKHPRPGVIQRLESRGIQIFRTDLEGTIKLKASPEKVTVD